MHEGISAANLSDALGKTQTMTGGISAITPGKAVMGPAYTVECYPTSIITCHKALGEVPAGHVLVIDGQGDPHGALFGELMSIEAMQRGVLGVVIDGAVRDTALIRAMGYPVWARHVTPRVGSNGTVGRTGGTVVCGGVAVHPGDLIVADDDGVVVVPAEQIEDVLRKAQALDAKMRNLAEQARAGAHLADLLGMGGAIAAAEAARQAGR